MIVIPGRAEREPGISRNISGFQVRAKTRVPE